MNRHPRVPLAWLNLTHNLGNMAWFCAGIGFAVLLMFLQYGCRNALLDANVLLLGKIRAPLVIVGKRQTTIILRATFPRDLLVRAAGVEGVASTHPLYLEYAMSMMRDANPDPAKRATSMAIRVVGVDPDAFVLNFPQLDPNSSESRVHDLHLDGRAIFDRLSKRRTGAPAGTTVYGPIHEGSTTDLAGQKIVVSGLFDLGVDFGTDGTLIVGEDTFQRVLRSSPYGPAMSDVDIGLIRLHPDADAERVKKSLQNWLGSAVDVMTKEELMEREQRFWTGNTPIGAVFGFGVFMGFLVGLVICYQILSTDIRDNLAAYATLRAIGYPNRFLFRVVVEEAVMLAVFGFVPGWIVSWGLYQILAEWTDLPLSMTTERVLNMLALTMIMCVGSGIFAAREAMRADPAEVF